MGVLLLPLSLVLLLQLLLVLQTLPVVAAAARQCRVLSLTPLAATSLSQLPAAQLSNAGQQLQGTRVRVLSPPCWFAALGGSFQILGIAAICKVQKSRQPQVRRGSGVRMIMQQVCA
jgi:hypothetical protein